MRRGPAADDPAARSIRLDLVRDCISLASTRSEGRQALHVFLRQPGGSQIAMPGAG